MTEETSTIEAENSSYLDSIFCLMQNIRLSTLLFSLEALALKSSFSPSFPVADKTSRTNEAIYFASFVQDTLVLLIFSKSVMESVMMFFFVSSVPEL